MQKVLTLLLLFCTATLASAQSGENRDYWQEVSESSLPLGLERAIVPQKYRALSLDLAAMQSFLQTAPLEETLPANQLPVLFLPMPDGSFQRFAVEYSPIMEKPLAERYPQIRTFLAWGIDDPTAMVRLDYTPQGFHAIVFSPYGTVYIDPYARWNTQFYISYYKKDFIATGKTFTCGVQDVAEGPATDKPFEPKKEKGHQHPDNDFLKNMPLPNQFGDCQRRHYRLAVSATGEYSNFHGGNGGNNNKAIVLAAQVTTMNRVNGIFERDCGLRMNLVANNDLIIYLTPGSDPFTNGNTGAMINENQTNTDAVIGAANYDIGHIFGTNSGGLAQLNSPCGGSKARGVTGSGAPVGDPFDIDYVAHEMGHQWGGNHTQNNNCNRANNAAFETGSGVTIMGYAGICAPNVANNSIDHFHVHSLLEIANFVTTGGSACDQLIASTNQDPVIDVPVPNYTIPKSTPFMLTADASDPDGNAITYCWEQYNNEVSTQAPLATNTNGPSFRCFSPTVSPTRYFPRLQDLVNNVSPTWEVLPSVARTMTFRCAVRDNAPNSGCTAVDETVLTVDGVSGPFVVNVPSAAGINWPALSNQTVTWNIAGTTAAPVSCANVDIFLSTDGGLTYPITLATAVPNTGSRAITVPNNLTTTARVMVKGNGNVFFDISNNNFTISTAVPTFTLTPTPATLTICNTTTPTFTVAVGSVQGFVNPVAMSATGLPAGAGFVFAPATVTPGNNTVMTISNIGPAVSGVFNINITGTSGATTISSTVTLTLFAALSSTTLVSPANLATNVSTSPVLTWNALAGAQTYQLQIATDAAFTNIVSNQTGLVGTSYTVSPALNLLTNYFWRVRGVNVCGNGAFSTAFRFTTGSCVILTSTNVPLAISGTGTPTINSTVTCPNVGTITDVNVVALEGTHSYVSDLRVSLISPANTARILFQNICTSNDNFDLQFDDAAAAGAIPCPPTTGLTYQPNQTLAAFNGQAAAGTWTLRVFDQFDQDGGSLDAWAIQVCLTPVAGCNLTATASATSTTCGLNNGTATATAVAGTAPFTYAWSNGATTASLTNLAPGAFTVTITDAAACSATASATVGASQAAVAAVSPQNGVLNCNTPALALTATGGGTYLWNNGNTTASITVGFGATYSVTVTNNGCTATANAAVGENFNVPPTQITGNLSICPGQSTTLTATGGVSYTWSNGATGNAITVTATGPYSVSAIGANGCTGTANVTVTASPGPNAQITANGPFNFCLGGTLTLTASGGGTYLWSNGATTTNINVTTTGTYSVTVTNNGCTASAVRNITTLPPPTVGISGTTTICGGQSTTLTATGTGTSYVWSTGSTQQSISVNTAGVYAVLVNDANNCTASAGVSVSLNAAPNAQITPNGPTTFCQGGVLTLTASGGGTYAWSTGSSAAAIQTTSSGTFTVTVTNNGCTATAVQVVTVNPVPNAQITPNGPTTFCQGGVLTLTASGGGTYAWSTGSNAAAIQTTSSGTFTVTVTNNGCSATAVQTVTVNPAPNAQITPNGPTTFCQGGSVTLTASGGGTYVWSNGSNAASIQTTASGTFTVTVTNNGCSATAVQTVTVNPVPNAQITPNGPTTFCQGGVLTLTASGGGTYAWSTGSSAAAIQTTSSGTFTVTVTNNGCSATATQTVTVNPVPNVQITPNGPTTFCQGGSVTLTASGGGTYVWSNGSNAASIQTTASGTFSVTVTNNGCTASAEEVVTVTNAPLASISGNQAICNGASTQLTATGGGTYAWSTGSTAATITVNTPGTYTVTVSLGAGCSATADATVIQSPAISITMVPVDVTCFGGNDGALTAAANGGTGTLSYLWGNGSTDQSILNITAGQYGVTITDAAGCSATANENVQNGVLVTATASNTGPYCLGTDIQLLASGADTYNWSGPDGFTSQDQDPIIVGATPANAGVYTVVATDASGCSASAATTVTLITSLQVFAEGFNETCLGESDGEATVSVNGGQAPYNYLWANGATDQSLFGLSVGTYEVTVTDASGCTGTGVATVGTAPDVTPPTIQCLPAQTISDSGSVTLPDFAGQVTAADNCGQASVVQTSPLPGTVYALSQVVNVTLTATDDAGNQTTCTVDVTIDVLNNCAGGGVVYAESFDNGANGWTLNVPTGINGNQPNSWEVNDSEGGIAPPGCGVGFNGDGTLHVTCTNILCTLFGFTGAAYNSGVTSNMSSESPAINTVGQNGLTLSFDFISNGDGLTDNASVWYNDGNGWQMLAASIKSAVCGNGQGEWTTFSQTLPASCENIPNLQIALNWTNNDDNLGTDPSVAINNLSITAAALVANITPNNDTICAGATTTLTASLGAAYIWSNGETTQTVEVGAGTYSVTVADAGGCTASASATVFTVTDITAPVIVCPATQTLSGTGSVALPDYAALATATDDCGAVTVTQVSPQPGTIFTSSQVVTVLLLATDAAGNISSCQFDVDVVVTNNCNFTAEINPALDTLCAGTTTTLTATAGSTYLWSTGETTQSIEAGAGTFDVTVEDAQGCTATATATVSELAALDVVIADIIDVTCFGGADGSVEALATGGIAPYTYSWSDGQADFAAFNLVAGTYNVLVTDQFGCTGSATAFVGEPTEIVTSFQAFAPSCPGNADGGATVFATGGTISFEYLWDNGASGQAQTQLASGNYLVTVTDFNGCTATVEVIVPVGVDVVPPVFANCPGDQTISLVGGPYTLVDFATQVIAADNCSTPSVVQLSPAPGTVYNSPQSVTVVLQATDADQNASVCSFVLSIEAAPQPACVPDSALVTWYVDASATGANNGTSWANAFTNLQNALAAASNGQNILVAEGTYRPTTGTNRTISFDLKAGVDLFGGFPTGGGPLADPAGNPTILSGDIGVLGTPTDNSNRVVRAINVGNNAGVCGFTIRDAYITTLNGGGIYVQANGNGIQSSPLFEYCIVRDNYSAQKGGGAFVFAFSSGQAAPTFNECLFTANVAANDGGGFMTISQQGGTINTAFTACTFLANTTPKKGGAIGNWVNGGGNTTMSVDNCSFESNSSQNNGGAVWNHARSGGACTFNANGSLFEGNSASVGGAVFSYPNGGPVTTNLTDCDFTANSSNGSGGAVCQYSELAGANGTMNITDCAFLGNAALEGGAFANLVLRSGTGTATLNRVVFNANTGTGRGGAAIISGNGLNAAGTLATTTFINAIFLDNAAPNGPGGAIAQTTISAAQAVTSIVNSTFTGNIANGQGSVVFNGALASPSSVTVVNSVVWNNTSLLAAGKSFWNNDASAALNISYSLLPLGPNCAANTAGIGTLTCGAGNLYAIDPMFVDAVNGDLHLMAGSSAIDAGTLGGAPVVDFDGNVRPQGNGIDMGAFEYGAIRTVARNDQAQPETAPITATVFPNPTTGSFTLALDRELTGLAQVFDAQGRLVTSQALNGTNQASFDLNGLTRGIYLIRIVSGEAVLTKQVVLSRP